MGRAFGRLVMVAIIAMVTMLGASSFVTNEAFANHLSEDLKWQLIFITSNGACSNNDIQNTNKYSRSY